MCAVRDHNARLRILLKLHILRAMLLEFHHKHGHTFMHQLRHLVRGLWDMLQLLHVQVLPAWLLLAHELYVWAL